MYYCVRKCGCYKHRYNGMNTSFLINPNNTLIFINVRRQPWIASFCQPYKKELLTLCRKGNPNTLFPETLCRKGRLLALLSSPTLSTSTTLEKPEQRPVPPLPLHHWCEDHRSLAFDGLRRPHLIGPWLSSVQDHGSGARSRLYPVFHHDLVWQKIRPSLVYGKKHWWWHLLTPGVSLKYNSVNNWRVFQ